MRFWQHSAELGVPTAVLALVAHNHALSLLAWPVLAACALTAVAATVLRFFLFDQVRTTYAERGELPFFYGLVGLANGLLALGMFQLIGLLMR